MFFHIYSLIYTIFFIFFLEVSAFIPGFSFYLALFVALFSLITAKKIGKRYLYTIIPFFFSLSSVLILYLVDHMVEKQTVLILSAIIYYLCFLGIYRLNNYAKDQTARGFISASAISTIFLSYAFSYGVYLNFSIPLWILMIVFFIVTFLVSYQYFSLIEENRRKIFIYSAVLGMIMSEVAWVINFWPFGYLTTGAIALIFYYIFWDLTQSHFLNILSKKRVVANVIFFTVMIVLILATSHWLPVV